MEAEETPRNTPGKCKALQVLQNRGGISINIGCKFGHIDKETNVDKVVSRNKITTVRSNASTIEVNRSFESNKNNAEKVAEIHSIEEAILIGAWVCPHNWVFKVP